MGASLHASSGDFRRGVHDRAGARVRHVARTTRASRRVEVNIGLVAVIALGSAFGSF